MKQPFLFSLVLGLAPLSLLAADVNVQTLAQDAADNTFAGHNYSWTTVLTRPDGSTVNIAGQTDQGNTATSVQGGPSEHQAIVVGEQRFVLSPDGWKAAGPADHPPADVPPGMEPPPGPPAGHRGGGPRDGFGRPPGAGRFMSPADHFTHLINHATNWSAKDDVLTAELTGPFGGRGKQRGAAAGTAIAPAAAGTATHVVTLWLQNGLLSKAEVVNTRPDPAGSSTPKVEKEVTTFSAVGTTTVTVPPEVQALLATATK